MIKLLSAKQSLGKLVYRFVMVRKTKKKILSIKKKKIPTLFFNHLDLRFPELFRSLTQMGAQIICMPSAFSMGTGIYILFFFIPFISHHLIFFKKKGKVHWKTLLSARAIENQIFVKIYFHSKFS